MTPILTYEIMRAETGVNRVFAVMNTRFIQILGYPEIDRLFGKAEDKFMLISGDNNFAMVVDADKNEDLITEAIDIVNEDGIDVEIRTKNIENHLNFGSDVNLTANSVQEILQNVQKWLDAGVFAPEAEDVMEFPT